MTASKRPASEVKFDIRFEISDLDFHDKYVHVHLPLEARFSLSLLYNIVSLLPHKPSPCP